MVACHRVIDADIRQHNGLPYGNNGVYFNGNQPYGLCVYRNGFSGDVTGNDCDQWSCECGLRYIEPLQRSSSGDEPYYELQLVGYECHASQWFRNVGQHQLCCTGRRNHLECQHDYRLADLQSKSNLYRALQLYSESANRYPNELRGWYKHLS